MTVLDFSAFVGMAPSVSPRGLGADYAQLNSNLFLRSGEFWPLAQDKEHGEAHADTRTLYRFQRNAAGELIEDASTAVRTFSDALSFVKGQINDELTERTYLTYDDGSQRPRAMDARGNDRLLGVARPARPTVKHNVVDEFTLDEATTWLYGEFAEKIYQALLDSEQSRLDEPRGRYDVEGNILIGASEKHGLYFYDEIDGVDPARLQPGMLYALLDKKRVTDARMDMTRLGGVDAGQQWAVGVMAMPAAVRVNWEAFEEAICLIEFPEHAGEDAGRMVLTAEQAGKISDKIKTALKTSYAMEKLRAELDSLLAEYEELVVYSYVNPLGDKPVAPTTPTVPEWLQYDGDSSQLYRNPKWESYDKELAAYTKALDDWLLGKETESSAASALNARAVEIQDRCKAICDELAESVSAQWDALKEDEGVGGEWVDMLGGVTELAGELTERVVDSRYYVVAFVTDWGEESEPSPMSDMLEVDANDTVEVLLPPLLSGERHAERHIKKWRLYRSNTSSTAAAWQLVAELGVEINGFLDDKPSSELDSLQPQFTWSEPPYRQDTQYDGELKPSVGTNPYLRGLRGMPNGMMAGFVDNMVAFCEPYVPYAWPYEYQVTTEFPVVGLGVFGQTLFVGTTGNPYFITGAHSASMSAVKLDSNQSCMSARSIIAVEGGVLYASPDGLCVATQAGVQCISGQHIVRDDWQRMKPSTMHAAEHEGIYYLFYEGNGGGCLVFDVETKKMGLVDMRASAVWVDKLHDLMYMAWGGKVLECFTGDGKRMGKWRSSVRTLARQGGLSWAKVYGNQTKEQPAIVRVYADGQLRHTATVTSLEPVRLPAGRWLEYELEVESQARITRVLACTTTEELRSV